MHLMDSIRSITLEDASRSPDEYCMPWAIEPHLQCQYVMDHGRICGEHTGLIPYLEIHYCTLGNQFGYASMHTYSSGPWVARRLVLAVLNSSSCWCRRLLSHVLQFSWIAVLLLMLMVVTQRFFCPALEVISDFLRLPPNVAGATLLSLGNGAPDFFTQIAAVAQMDASSIPIAVGEPIGGGLFVSNVVLAFVVFVGGRGSPVEIEKGAFLRDVGFYCGATLLVSLIAADGMISLREALTMVAYYCVFVAYIAIFERTSSGSDTPSAAEAPSDSTAAPLLDEATLSLGGNGADTEPGDAANGGGGGGHSADDDAKPSLLAISQTPLRWLARLTMPEVATAGASRYPRACAVLLPVTAPLFVVLVKRLALSGGSPLNGDALLYGAVCSGFASMLTAALYPADGRHRGVLTGFFTVMAFCMSVLWMNILSAEMVRAWKVLGYIHAASQRMLGVTVLAWVNSSPDFISDVSLAHAGLPSMAVAATFASPLFTLIGGLGFTFLLAVVLHGPVRFDPGLPLQVAIGFAVVSVFRHLALMPLLRWRLTRVAAVGMLAFYAVFQVVYLTLVMEQPR